MKNKKKFPLATTIGAAALAVVAIAATVVGSYYGGTIDAYMGLGKETVVKVKGSESWDSEYYSLKGMTAEQVHQNARDLTEKIASEGMTLLKNNASTLPLKTSKTGGTDKKVTLFGRRSVQTLFGGTGSGGFQGNDETIRLIPALESAGFQVNPTVKAIYESTDNQKAVPTQKTSMDKLTEMQYYIGEYPQSYYTNEVKSSFSQYGDAAIVVIGRDAGEGMDLARNMKATINESKNMTDNAETANWENDQHELELSKEEKDLLALAKANFSKVIVLINSANVMEVGSLKDDADIDSIVWMGYPGSTGCAGLAGILNGKYNPSGHTVDMWERDFTADPTFANVRSSLYTNVSGNREVFTGKAKGEANAISDSATIEYEEGIYIGYRYYETVYADSNIFTVEGAQTNYDGAVAYPFGYGLSYTNFTQKIKSASNDGKNITMTITVKNVGDVAGKDVIQLYYHAPYGSQCDGYTSTIEKADVVLAAFDKTDELQPNQEKDYTLSFDIQDMASYDFLGEKCYVLDAGEYTVSLRKNSHELYATGTEGEYKLSLQKEVFNKSNPRRAEKEHQTGLGVNMSEGYLTSHEVVAATNLFKESNDHFVSYQNKAEGKATMFTRANFAASFPTAPAGNDLVATPEILKNLNVYVPDYYDETDKKPLTGQSNNITCVALRGAPYDDAKWEKLLDQLTVKEMSSLIYQGNQGSVAVKSINMPGVKGSDGPAGLKQFSGLGLSFTGNSNVCEPIVAATWNTKLAKEYGQGVGKESIVGGLSTWYAPGFNTHRNHFGGRNMEYYSEDPLIAGLIGAAVIEGCGEYGLNTYLKHFALNDTDYMRMVNGVCTWATEQTMREIYLKAFEIAFTKPVCKLKYLEYQEDANGRVTGAVSKEKDFRCSVAVMSSFNRIGSKWAGGSTELLTNVLRDEWGFQGSVVTDYNDREYMSCEDAIISGGDFMLANEATLPIKIADTSKASTLLAMRQAAKNVIYTNIHSSCLNNKAAGDTVQYGLSPRQLIIYGVDAVCVLGIAACIVVPLILSKKKGKAEEQPQ